ncbi:hypothetical protein LCGC14_2610050, partial [marine sediment metagenome]
ACELANLNIPYRLDGSVIEVVNPEIRTLMGSTSHHHRYVVALKKKGETKTATVEGITWQVGRSGRLTPVINIEPTYLSGATISNITGVHAGYLKQHKIGVGAVIELVRAGEVIPDFLRTISEGEDVSRPLWGPGESEGTKEDGDVLYCVNEQCADRVVSRLSHFFTILGNVDLFGRKTIEKLVANGVDDLPTIYALDVEQFKAIGFGDKQSQNLIDQLIRSRTESVQDFKFLAGIGIHHLGRGDSRKLLAVHPVESLITVDATQIAAIRGFGEITSKSIAAALPTVWPVISALLTLGFNLETAEPVKSDTSISGKNVVFTGSMSSSRDDMKSTARQLGANVQSKPTAKTDFLIIGKSVGQAKIDAAEKHGTKVITEEDYLGLIAA